MLRQLRRLLPGGCVFLLFCTAQVLSAQTPSGARHYDPSQANAVVAGTTSMEVLDTTRRLGPGDRLSYRIVEERREPIGLIVADSGEVEFPLIGRVAATGKTCKELAYSIKPTLEHDYFFKATVIIGLDAVSEKSRGRVYISGQIRSQGSVEIPPDERFTLTKALLKAGGFADFASKKVKLIRRLPDGSSKTTIIDVDAITKGGHWEKDVELLPDDRIIVPERFINL
jgi:protein involved in polysaccharide export with SLBB domain